MSVADLNAKMALAISAQESGDYATALTYLRSAKMLLIQLPDSAGPIGISTQWDRTAIDSLISEATRLLAGRRGIQRTKVNRVLPDSDCD